LKRSSLHPFVLEINQRGLFSFPEDTDRRRPLQT
jgi:hypothetical protein